MSVIKKGRLNIMVALPAEARIFIDCYRLKQCRQVQTYPIYTNRDNTIYLIISGVGKIKAAAATAFLLAFTGYQFHTCFLNLGIAGHPHYELGKIIMVNKIQDVATGQTWYPTSVNHLKLEEACIKTYDEPNYAYRENVLVDMEASGFFVAASQCLAQEQILILKIISDNSVNDIKNITSEKIAQLVQNQSDVVNVAIEQLLKLSENEYFYYEKSPYYFACLQRWHFTEYQQHELRELLRRWQVNHPHEDPLSKLETLTTSKDVISYLEQILEKEYLADNKLRTPTEL